MHHKKTFRLELDSVKLRGMVSYGLDSVKCHSINRCCIVGWSVGRAVSLLFRTTLTHATPPLFRFSAAFKAKLP